MNRIAWRLATAGLLMAFTAAAQTVPQQERTLSKAESAIVARQMPQDWQNISFVCEVNPATAQASRFQSTPLPPQ